jgi:AcrR family transcriptional regulator
LARNSELNQKMKDERKGQILSTALKLFATKGLAATKISDISSLAGFSQGLVYHYYKSKEEIFIELIQNAFDKINTASRNLEEMELSPKEKIKMAIEGILQNLEENENHALYHLLIAQSTASDAIPDEAKKIIQSKNSFPYEVMTRIIKSGQKDGSIKNYKAEDLALLFWTSIKGLAIHKAVHGKKHKMPDPEILMNMFV